MSDDHLKDLVHRYFAHLDEIQLQTEAYEERMRKMRGETALLLAQIREAAGVKRPNADDPIQQFRPDPR